VVARAEVVEGRHSGHSFVPFDPGRLDIEIQKR
jgi:hypothetical protein